MVAIDMTGAEPEDNSPAKRNNKGALAAMAANNDTTSADVICLTSHRKVVAEKSYIPDLQPGTVAVHLYRFLKDRGVSIDSQDSCSDFKIIAYMIQGMMERQNPENSDRRILLDVLRQAFDYDKPPVGETTDELFGELLRQINDNGQRGKS